MQIARNHVKTFRKMRRQVVVDVISRDLGRPVWRHPILVTRLLVAPSLPNKMGIFFYISLSLTHWNFILLWKGPNTSNTKLISASENYSRRDIGQNLLFILLFGSELRFGLCKICNANPSFSICMGNRHVWNLAASLMCCPMVIYDSTPLSAPSHAYMQLHLFLYFSWCCMYWYF